MLVLAACTQHPATPPPATPAPVASGPRIVLPDRTAISVEIAADDATREQGLMYRDQMPQDHGMIFLFPQSGDYPFWMKNTLIALDMLWIDDAHRIVHIASNVPPCKADPCPSYPPNASAKYVLELNAGVAGKHGLKNGDVLRFVDLENVIIR